MDALGLSPAVWYLRWMAGDSPGRVKSTSQAEYAGSIPVIGSIHLGCANGVESVRTSAH
jgi:hypothetical protein